MKKSKNILGLFLENEKKIQKLYVVYSEKIIGHELFWRALAREEESHVRMLRELNLYYKGNDDLFETNEHFFGIFDYIGDFVESEIKKAQSEKISQEHALEISLRIERSMIEKKCFEMVKPEKTEILKVFRRLNKETDGHMKALIKEVCKSSR